MARFRKHSSVAFVQPRATGFPLLHVEMLYGSLQDPSGSGAVADWDVEARRMYYSAVYMVYQACVRVEAVTDHAILFADEGAEVARYLSVADMSFPVAGTDRRHRVRIQQYIVTVRTRFITMLMECSTCLPSIPQLCADEGYAVADIAERFGMTGSDFVEYINVYRDNAVPRLAICQAVHDYRVLNACS